MNVPILRVARPSHDLERLLPFYRDGLGLRVLYRFKDCSGSDGVMLGHDSAPYHFEFTQTQGSPAGRAPAQDSVLIFYMPDVVSWKASIDRMYAAGFAPVAAPNPCWDRSGISFEDPAGYLIVFQCAAWSF